MPFALFFAANVENKIIKMERPMRIRQTTMTLNVPPAYRRATEKMAASAATASAHFRDGTTLSVVVNQFLGRGFVIAADVSPLLESAFVRSTRETGARRPVLE